MPTMSEFHQVDPFHIDNLDTGKVPKGLHQLGSFCFVNNERSFAVDVRYVPQLTLFGVNRVAVLRLLGVSVNPDLLQKFQSYRGLFHALG
ncbi:hypothetical protein ACFX2I_040501 [Malus domestica]